MGRGKPDPVLNVQIVDEAAHWLVELHAGDMNIEKRREFDAWLRESPAHVRAYLEMLPLWDEAALVHADQALDAGVLVKEAHQDEVVVALEQPAPLPPRSHRRSTHMAFLTAAAIAAMSIVSVWYVSQRHTYSTDVGEQRAIALSDGSSVELNARSRVRVVFDAEIRRVELMEGQALFRVHKDPRRPFIVTSGATQVRAVGTQFDVYRKRSGTTVTVLEGRVAVTSSATRTGSATKSAPEPVIIAAGEQVVATPTAVARAAQPNPAAATAWRERQLVFSGTPLLEVAEEFNRYNERQLIVRDSQLEAVRVNGMFSSTDPAPLIRFLRAQPDLDVEETDDEIRVFSRQAR